MIPDEYMYTETHEWLLTDNNAAVVGITDFAQGELGDIVYVDLPSVGLMVPKGSVLAVLESAKAVSEIYSPVTGRVKAVNSHLEESPELINEDPYGRGWIVQLDMVDPDCFDTLKSPEQYRQILQGK